MVSNDGLVMSFNKRGLSGKTMKQSDSAYGYKVLNIRVDGKTLCKKVHRLVAEAFLPNPDNHPFVNHIDGDKTNNSVSNLEWCTPKQNVHHALSTGLASPVHWQKAGSQSRKKKVIRDDGAVFDCIRDAAVSIGLSDSSVSDCLHGRRRGAGGHTFAFYEEAAT